MCDRLSVRLLCGQIGRGAIVIFFSCRLERFSDMQCKNIDRLGTMHTSEYRRFVWYENQRVHWFHQSARSFTEEDEEEYDDENSRFAYERFIVWRDEGTYGPINHSYG